MSNTCTRTCACQIHVHVDVHVHVQYIQKYLYMYMCRWVWGREEIEGGREGNCSRGIHMGSGPRLNISYVWPVSWLAGLIGGDEPRVQGFRRCYPFFIVAYIWAQPAELPW